ncbi:MAG TPA: tetratricopeptide repeat protein, partial [Isosphaeraceae bacterium]|nr:tetratricopeptide repeat protein [Isosphaeraceae bacterium]
MREADAQAAEVHRLWETGKSQEALPLARKVVATRRELLGEAHEMVANSLGRLAEYQEALGDIDGARAARQQVVDIRVRLLGKTHWEVTDARLALADCQRLATLTPGSRLELKSADQLFHEAGELRARGRFREAISPVQQSLAIRRRLLGEDHRLVADALNRLGLLYFSQLELDQADAPYQQAATIRKRVLGEDHPDYAESLNNLATIAMKRARPGQAEEMLKRAKEIMKTSFGEQNASYLICLHDLAGFYHNRGDLAQAEAIMRQALGIARTVFEPEDPMYLGFLSDLATVLVKRADDQLGRGQYESAQRLLWERRAFEAMAYGDLDWRTTDARLDWSDANRLARLEPDQRRLFAESMAMLKRSEESSRRGEFRDAVDGAEEALRGLEATLGRGNRRCLRIVDRLGVLLARQGKLAGAESVLLRSTEAHRLALGEEHPDYAATLINLSRVYSIQRRRRSGRALGPARDGDPRDGGWRPIPADDGGHGWPDRRAT